MNAEERREYYKKYAETHKEQIREYRKRYAETHREKRREYQKKYVENHKEEIREKSKKWREEHYEERRLKWTSPEALKETRERKKLANDLSFIECDKEKWHRVWTDDEVEFLIENYQDMTIPQIAKELGRTHIAVERKRNKLGLKKGAEEIG